MHTLRGCDAYSGQVHNLRGCVCVHALIIEFSLHLKNFNIKVKLVVDFILVDYHKNKLSYFSFKLLI